MALLRRHQQHDVSALVVSRLEWSLWHPVHFGAVQEPEQSVESIIALPRSTTHRNQYMDVAYVSALSALAGSVVGRLTSGFTTWLSQRAQAKAGQLAHNLSRREDLFADFVVAASKAYGEALMSNEPQVRTSSPSTP